jgi:ketosteroid isomerase-like protein
MNRFFPCFCASLFLSYAAIAQNSSARQAAPAAPASASPVQAPSDQAPPAQAQSGVTSTVRPEVAQIQKIEDSWADAVNRHDQYGIELVLSPLFVDVSATGDVTTRNQQVVQVINGEDKTVYLTQKVITVRMLGDIAVANGTYTYRHKVNSAPVEEKGVFTHVFERVHGGWLCINSQRTILRQDSNTNSRQKKSSTAEMPFHIPLFTKDDKGPQP